MSKSSYEQVPTLFYSLILLFTWILAFFSYHIFLACFSKRLQKKAEKLFEKVIDKK